MLLGNALKGSVHLIESFIASLILLSFVLIYFNVDSETPPEGEDYPQKIFSSQKNEMGIILPMREKNIINISQYKDIRILYDGKITKLEESEFPIKRINDSFIEVLSPCSLCGYHLILSPQEFNSIKYVYFYDNETGYVVIE